MDDRIVGDIFVDYSASEGLHSIYIKCKDLLNCVTKSSNFAFKYMT